MNWLGDGGPGPYLIGLDNWILRKAGSSIKDSTLYSDLRNACAARIAVAKSKAKVSKKIKSESIEAVAKSIVKDVSPAISARQFPESFSEKSPTIHVNIPRGQLAKIEVHPLLGSADIHIWNRNDSRIYNGHHHRSVAEAIVRGLMFGREGFDVPNDPTVAEKALTGFLQWFDRIRTKLDEAIMESALGTGYEDLLKSKIYAILRVHPMTGLKTLPRQIDFPVSE